MSNITVNIPNSEELERRRKAKLEKMKALAKKSSGEQGSSKEIIPSSETVAKPPPVKRAKTTREKKTTRASSGLSDIPEEGTYPDTAEVADIDTTVVKDVVIRLDKGKSVKEEVIPIAILDGVLYMSRSQKMNKEVKADDETIALSALLLREFTMSL